MRIAMAVTMAVTMAVMIVAASIGAASASETARTTHGGIPVPLQPVVAAPTSTEAPSQGVITRVDLAARSVSVTGRDMRIDQPYVAILDKRPNATGLIRVPDLRVGMRVRYRAAEGTSNVPRVLVLWILSDAPTAVSPERKR